MHLSNFSQIIWVSDALTCVSSAKINDELSNLLQLYATFLVENDLTALNLLRSFFYLSDLTDFGVLSKRYRDILENPWFY